LVEDNIGVTEGSGIPDRRQRPPGMGVPEDQKPVPACSGFVEKGRSFFRRLREGLSKQGFFSHLKGFNRCLILAHNGEEALIEFYIPCIINGPLLESII